MNTSAFTCVAHVRGLRRAHAHGGVRRIGLASTARHAGSPAPSSSPSIRFAFCIAWPAAPFIRLSIALNITQRRCAHALHRTHRDAHHVAVLYVPQFREFLHDLDEPLALRSARARARAGQASGAVSGTVIVARIPRAIGRRCGVKSRSASDARVRPSARASPSRCRCEFPTPYARKFSVTSPKSRSSAWREPGAGHAARRADVDRRARRDEPTLEERKESEQDRRRIAAGIGHALGAAHLVAPELGETVGDVVARAVPDAMVRREVHDLRARGARARDPLRARAVRQRGEDERARRRARTSSVAAKVTVPPQRERRPSRRAASWRWRRRARAPDGAG